MSNVTEEYADLAAQLRIDSIRSTTKAGSGHPTSSMSAADLLAVLMKTYLKYDSVNPHAPTNDHLIFSKGHAAPLLYACYRAAGWITDAQQLSLREFGSIIEGHPVPLLPYVDVATGSLGQGLPIGVGIAWVGKFVDKLPYKVWVLLGDSEMAEGSIWEGFDKASHYGLNNLVAILDMNRLGQRGETDLGWNSAAYAARASAFGLHAIEIDGHNLDQIVAAYDEAIVSDKPVLIIAKTEKGHGFAKIANQPNWHGKALPQDLADEAIAGLGGEKNILISVHKPAPGEPAAPAPTTPLSLPRYELGTIESARKAYGDALLALGASNSNILATDAEVSNSTYADEFSKAFPDRFFEVYIAEQQLVSAVVGFSVRGKIGFASTFAAFFSRAFDFIRMAAISRANIRLVGSHAGVSIGEDGPSQMALEDLAMMRAIHESTVLYPSDANQTAHLTALMAEQSGISYLRTTREKLPVIYSPDEKFTIGGSKVFRQSENDQITVVGAGITLHEAIKAADQLATEGIHVRVIDLYSIKPVDKETLHAAAKATGLIITVEDHWPEGGVGDAVLEAFTGTASNPTEAPARGIIKLAVTKMPGSGKPYELLADAGIDAAHIANAVKALVG
jgi:transketolase